MAENRSPYSTGKTERFKLHYDFADAYLPGILGTTAKGKAFIAFYLDEQRRVISHQTFAVGSLGSRRIDIKRALSLLNPSGCSKYVIIVESTPATRKPEWEGQGHVILYFWDHLRIRGLKMIDYTLYGSRIPRSAWHDSYSNALPWPHFSFLAGWPG